LAGTGVDAAPTLSCGCASAPPTGPGAATSCAAVPCSTEPTTTGAPAAVGGGVLGNANGLALVLSGISMGISTSIGLGWVSNNSGKPITPTSTSTAAPTRRWRALLRMASILSAGAAATLLAL